MSYQRKQTAEKYEEYKKYFEKTYHYCKDPQVFFYKSKKGKYIHKTMKDVLELERHNEEYIKEWCCDENRKIYEMSDYVPVKHIKDPQIFNTFRGYMIGGIRIVIGMNPHKKQREIRHHYSVKRCNDGINICITYVEKITKWLNI